MKKIWFVMLLIAGCVSPQEVSRLNQDMAELKRRVTSLERRFAKATDTYKEIFKGYETGILKLREYIDEIRKDIETSVGSLHMKVRAMEDSLGIKSSSKSITVEEVSQKIKKAIKMLQTGEKVEIVFLELGLKEFPQQYLPRLFNVLRLKMATEKDEQLISQIQRLIAEYDPPELRQILPKELKSRDLKFHAVKIIKLKKDFELSKLLLPYKNATDDEFRLCVAVALFHCSNEESIPVLIDFLSHKDEPKRIEACRLLKTLVKDLFGYKFYIPVQRNEQAIANLRKWYESNKGKILKK